MKSSCIVPVNPTKSINSSTHSSFADLNSINGQDKLAVDIELWNDLEESLMCASSIVEVKNVINHMMDLMCSMLFYFIFNLHIYCLNVNFV